MPHSRGPSNNPYPEPNQPNSQTNKKKILNYKPKVRRNIRRPQTRWEEDFREERTGIIVDDDN